jgi:hypothetical protein
MLFGGIQRLGTRWDVLHWDNDEIFSLALQIRDVHYGKKSTQKAPGVVDRENCSTVFSARATKGSFSLSDTAYP